MNSFDVFKIYGNGNDHFKGNDSCSGCDYSNIYPILCKCGGLLHREKDRIKCDKCGKQNIIKTYYK